MCCTDGYCYAVATMVEGKSKLAQGCGFYLCYVLSSGGKGEGGPMQRRQKDWKVGTAIIQE